MRALLLVALLLPLAGCLSSAPSGDDGSDGMGETVPERHVIPEDPMPEGAGHDHADADAHKFLWHYEFASRDPLLQNDAQIAGLHAIDIAGEHLFGAVYGANAVAINGGLVIWDISDPGKPVETGRWVVPGAVGGDRSMEVTSDGAYAVLGTETVDCLGHVNPTAVSVYLIDTNDKATPVAVDVVSVTGQSRGGPTRVAPSIQEHSIAVHKIGEEDFAFVFGKIFRIDRGDETQPASLVPTGARINVGHDLYVRDTPWGDVWALSANGGGGLQIYDVTDPTDPVEIANWDLPDRQELAEQYYFHTADVAFFEDQIIVIVSSEDWEDHASPLWILDATGLEGHEGDPLLLEHIGTWVNPGEHTAVGVSFSLHNPRFGEDGVLSISSYHGGLWQMDFRHRSFRAEPDTVAYAVYAEGQQTQVQDPVFSTIESGLCGLGLTLDAPTYMDVALGPGGILYAADVYMGLYAFTPTPEHPVYGDQAAITA